MRTKDRPTRLRRTGLLAVAGLLASLLPVFHAATASAAGTNLALGKAVSVSSTNSGFPAGNLNDNNQASYWESTNGSTVFPQWAQIDLGSSTQINQVVLQLPTGWGSRTQTLSIQGSTDNSTFSTIVASATYTFDPNSSNTVTINFGTATTRYVRANITANSGWAAAQISEFQIYGPSGTTSTNLALNKTTSASGTQSGFPTSNAVDGNQSTYWESTNNAFPQWLQVDLGSSVSINKVVLQVPASGWAARTETLSVQGSTDNSSFSTIVASAGYTFDPNANGNTVTINFNATTTRYLRLNITANTGWSAGQISEFQVYGPTSGDVTPPSAPTNLAFTQSSSGAVTLTWGASTDNVAVTGYDVYANNVLLTSVPSTALTYTDNPPTTSTITYFVRAHDAAGNQSANSNSVTRNGQGATAPTPPTNLQYTQPVSGQINLTWGAATDAVGVTGYNVYRNSAKIASVSGTTLTYTDTVATTLTVSYYVTATNAAGLESTPSNTVTRTGSGGTGTNLALNKPIDGTAFTNTFAPANANDGDVTTYFEGSSYPSQLTVHLGANADITSVVIKLNPATIWSARTQTIAVLGREQSATTFSTLAAAQSYSFDPNSNANTVTIPVSARVADVEVSITTNSGAPGGQVGELQVMGTPSPNPDLTPTSSSWTPSAPIETDNITASAVITNQGTAASVATDVGFYLGSNKVGSTTVGALAPGASQTVSASIGTQSAGTYQLTTKVDETKKNFETQANQSYTNPTNLVVTPVQSADLVGTLSWVPGHPSGGSSTAFSVTIKNQGTIATTSGSHGVTVTLQNSTTGATVTTLTGSISGVIASGATTAPVSLGSWTAVNGKYNLHMVIATDPNELAIKVPHLTSDTPFFVGQGANMPYDQYEAEAGSLAGGAAIVGPNRTIGDIAGEASGRQAVTLNSTGASVAWTSRESTNTFVVRYSIPDASGGGGINATLDLYANGTLVEPLNLTSHYAWLYGAETGPGDSPGSGSPRHIYDESSFLLPNSYPIGTVFKLQKDSSNSSQYAVDFMNLEQTASTPNPDPAHLMVPAGFTSQDVQNAINTVSGSSTLTGVYLPAGQYALTGRIQVGGKGMRIVGAGVWYTQFVAPQGQTNTDTGFDVQSTASGSSFSGFAWFGNYTTRIDGPGHTFQLTNTSNISIDNVWIEHNVVGVWGLTAVKNSSFTNMRIRDTLADGINLTNGSQGNTISNDEARSTGDDSFALFAAQDSCSGCKESGNTIQNVTALTTWRAAGVAVYGGVNNTIQNFYVADTLCYPGLTVSSLNFGFPFEGFEDSPPTTIASFSLARDGGHFWGSQAFGAIWMFSATNTFTGLRINDATITDPTYTGIMFQTDYVGGTAQAPFQDTIFTNTTITGAHANNDGIGNGKSGFGVWANPLPEAGQGPPVGAVTFNHLVESNNDVNVQNTTSTLTITINP